MRPPRRFLSFAPFLLLGLLCLTVLTERPAAAQVYKDSFDGATLGCRWTPIVAGDPAPAIQEENGQAVVRIPANAQGQTFFAGFDSVPWLEGDFDIELDYTTPTWPVNSGVRLGLEVNARNGTGGAIIERVGYGAEEGTETEREVYLTHDPDGVHGPVITTDRSGTLRFVRVGGLLSGYFRSTRTGPWVLVHAGAVPNTDMQVRFRVWSHEVIYCKKPVVVAFNEFRVMNGKVVRPVEPEGLKAPLAALAPLGQTAPLPPRKLQRNKTIPLKLRLLACGKPLTGRETGPPKIAGLVRNDVPLNISRMDLDEGRFNGNGLEFRSVYDRWVYKLRGRALKKGRYILVLEMPDRKQYSAQFVMK
jgi:hypothetical protein